MSDVPIQKSNHAEREEKILAFWKEKGIFKKSLDKKAPKGDFTFYDGPPFATGLPHYGHILAGTMKDVIPRFKTMQGYRVRRRWGWDCHGLPVENIIEKELGFKSKKDILDYGIGKFNAAARTSVMRYADEWRAIVPRLGRWVDMEDDYRTMDASYTETVWWIFKQLYDKSLIYEGFKSMYLCPRCETTLSNFEVAQGYKDITDISVYVKFELSDEPGTYLLAWTTTPWTLPGNVALAINPAIDYVKVKVDGKIFILANERLLVLKDKTYEVLATFKGSDLVGKSYKPIFNYYSQDKSLKNSENGWKIYGADFVTTETGTGVVHIAPAFGTDDHELSLEENLPFVQHVSVDGTFKKEVTDFAGLHVKPRDTAEDKNAHQNTDIEVIKWLAHNDFLFEKEKVVHSYPHCWRCETPLINYAASSWFVKVTAFKDKLVAENKKVKWVPPEIGSNRFGDWLEGARDWAISRSRFWGAPIPVWREEGTDKIHVIGSVADLKKFSRAKNTYHVMRHGEAENNVKGILSGNADFPHHLTAKGREQVAKTANKLKNAKIDLVFVSPFVRTRDTADVVKEKLGLKDDQLIVDKRIGEMQSGSWDGKDVGKWIKEFPWAERFERAPEGGETIPEIKKRMGDFLYDVERKYSGKTILVVTHETPGFLLMAAAEGMDRKTIIDTRDDHEALVNAEVKKVDFAPLPHNADYELDLHRPFIDNIELKTAEGHKLVRVPDVFDCWFESGSMPYGEQHYPFRKQSVFKPLSGIFRTSKGFPADFIAEGLDQTRGWFYSMIVLGVALFGKSPYKKVLVNGLVLAEDGQKMSKSKQNYPDPMVVVNKYGADALRYYLMSSPVVHGEDLRFSEKGVDEVTKKVVNRLLNVVSFYEMYAREKKKELRVKSYESANVLDKWIIARLNQTVVAVTDGLEKGELDRASRPIDDLTEDLSTWYLRRSRDRFKGDDATDKKAALDTTRNVLETTAKLLAPFMPFLAEDIYRKAGGAEESVHLDVWPKPDAIDLHLLEDMKKVKTLSSLGLEARTNAKINVRQPLSKLSVKDVHVLSVGLIQLVKDEVNVKDVAFEASIETDVSLDTTISAELKEEGSLRELIRAVQDMRKEKGLSVGDKASLIVTADKQSLISKYGDTIKKSTGLENIEVGEIFSLK